MKQKGKKAILSALLIGCLSFIPGYGKTNTKMAIPVKLKPNTAYEFGLNDDGYHAFASNKGDILYPVVIPFKTRKK